MIWNIDFQSVRLAEFHSARVAQRTKYPLAAQATHRCSTAFARGNAMSLLFMPPLLGQELHDIAPPVDYSLIPLWAVFAISFVALTLAALIVRWFLLRRNKTEPARSPSERALEALNNIG